LSIELNVLYEDDELVVMKAPHDEELVELVYKFISQKGRPVTWRELREAFSGIAGEDRLRKALHRLRNDGRIVELKGGRYATPDMPGVLEELKERMRRRILREFNVYRWRDTYQTSEAVN
jgi:DNA-binding transcriptional regulator PaaX